MWAVSAWGGVEGFGVFSVGVLALSVGEYQIRTAFIFYVALSSVPVSVVILCDARYSYDTPGCVDSNPRALLR